MRLFGWKYIHQWAEFERNIGPSHADVGISMKEDF